MVQVSNNPSSLSKVRALVLLEDGRLASTESRRIQLWNTDTGNVETELIGNRTLVTALAPLKGDSLANGTCAGIVKIWQLSTEEVVKTISAHTSGVTCIVQLDEQRLATAAEDGSIKVWDIHSGKELIRFAENFGWVISLVVLPDGTLASASQNDRFIRIWDTVSGEVVKSIDAREPVYSLAVYKDGSLASGQGNGRFRVWRGYKNSSEKVYTQEADQVIWLYVEGPIYSIAYQENGQLVTGSNAGKVRVYNLNKPARSIRVFHAHINKVDFLVPLKGDLLASGSEDGRIQIINVKRDFFVRTMGSDTPIVPTVLPPLFVIPSIKPPAPAQPEPQPEQNNAAAVESQPESTTR